MTKKQAKPSKIAKTTTKRVKSARPTTAPKVGKRHIAPAPPKPAPPKPPKAPKAPKPTSLVTQRRNALNDKTLPELKALLKTNDQVTTGTKGKLVKRIVECVTNGCLPRFPSAASAECEPLSITASAAPVDSTMTSTCSAATPPRSTRSSGPRGSTRLPAGCSKQRTTSRFPRQQPPPSSAHARTARSAACRAPRPRPRPSTSVPTSRT